MFTTSALAIAISIRRVEINNGIQGVLGASPYVPLAAPNHDLVLTVMIALSSLSLPH